jgi:hypothetical protein
MLGGTKSSCSITNVDLNHAVTLCTHSQLGALATWTLMISEIVHNVHGAEPSV